MTSAEDLLKFILSTFVIFLIGGILLFLIIGITEKKAESVSNITEITCYFPREIIRFYSDKKVYETSTGTLIFTDYYTQEEIKITNGSCVVQKVVE